MLGRIRFAARPKWLALHLLSLVLIVTMVLLGRWQLHVSNSKHFNLQNFGYALQWWTFSIFVALMWVRVLRDTARRAGTTVRTDAGAETGPVDEVPVAYRRYVMPQLSVAPGAPVDAEHAAYNEYLAGLEEQPEPRRREGAT